MKSAIFKVGPLSLHWFGIILTVALVAGLLVSLGLARLRRQHLDYLAPILLLGLLTGVIGGRVWYVAFRRDFYSPDPGRIFAVWEGGMALQGALIGGILATLIYTWYRELDFWTWADICAPGVVLGQAIGRIGDLVNNQAFGTPTSGTWAVIIPASNRPPAYQAFSHFQPTAAYEGVLDVAVFVVLIALTLLQVRRLPILPAGSIFLAYLVLYSIGRIPIEGMRVDSLYLDNVRVAQAASIVFIVTGIVFYVARLWPREIPATVQLPVVRTQATEAYFIAASRSGQARPGTDITIAQPPVWEDMTQVLNGHLTAGPDVPKLATGATGTLATPPTEEAS